MNQRGGTRLRPSAEDLGWLGVVPAAAVLAAAIKWLAEPLSNFYLDRGYDFYPSLYYVFGSPEPEETAAFLLAIAVPAMFAAAVLRFGGNREPLRSLEPPVIAVQVGLVMFLAWAVHKQGNVVSLAFTGRFERYLLPEANLVAAPLIGLALAALAAGWDSPRLAGVRAVAERVRSAPAWPAAAVAVLATVLWLLPGVITDEGLSTSGLIPSGHVPIELDEFAAASNGRTPLVDYVPWYSSLAPIALSWWWPLFDLSVTSFTVTMVVFSGLALMAAYAAFRNLVQSAWWALALYLPFLAMALQPWDTGGAVREFNGSYYAIMPQRYLGPFVVLWLCARHLRRGSPPLWLLFGVAGLAAFNNPEFGGPALIGMTAALTLGSQRNGPLGPQLRRAGAEAGAGLAGALLLACLVILVRSGELPNPELFGYVARVTQRGYGLAAMPDWGLHWALYVTYAAALVTASVRFAARSPDRVLTALLAFAGIFGLLTGAYFAGRSLPWQLWGLFPAWGLALALLGLAAWRALRTLEGHLRRRAAVGAVAALTGFGLMVASIDRFPLPLQQLDRISADGESGYDSRALQRFIEQETEPGEEVLLLGNTIVHRVAERAGVENVSPWFSIISLFGPAETTRAIDQLEGAGGNIVFLQLPPDDPTFRIGQMRKELSAALRERGYVPVARDAPSLTVEWRAGGG